MNKKKIHKLTINNTFDFHLIGLASHENDYRLSWAINSNLHFNLIQTEPHQVTNKKNEAILNFNVFEHEDEDTFVRYLLISNRNENGILIPELKNFDYFLEVKGDFNENDIQSLKQRLNSIDIIQTCMIIDIQSLKSKNNLILE